MARKNKGAQELTIQEESASYRNARVREICMETGGGPKNERPGSEYAPGQILMTACAMCGRPMTIVPRTHPYSLRRYDGTVAWLCGPCSGAKYRGEDRVNYHIER